MAGSGENVANDPCETSASSCCNSEAGFATFGLLINPRQKGYVEAEDIEQTAAKFALKVRTLYAGDPGELDKAFVIAGREHIDGLIITVDSYFFAESSRLGSLAARYAVPTIGSLRAFAAAGGLVSFNGSVPDNMHQTAL